MRQNVLVLAGALLVVGIAAGPSTGSSPSTGTPSAVGRQAPSLGLRPAIIGPGDRVRVWGRISEVRRAVVALQLRRHGTERWRVVSRDMTDRRGRYAFRLPGPSSQGTFEMRVRVLGARPGLAGVRSLTVSTSVTPPVTSPSPTQTTQTTQAADEVAPAEVVALANAERAAAGCRDLVVDRRLGAAASAHSQDLAAHRLLSHTGSDGRGMADRIRDAGYGPVSRLAENVAEGYPTASAVMQGWLASGSHRTNILDCRLRDVGVGVAHDADGTAYWTMDLGQR